MLKSLIKKKEKLSLINLKITDKEKAAIVRKARQYAGGNVSGWLRYAGTELTPRNRDLKKKSA